MYYKYFDKTISLEPHHKAPYSKQEDQVCFPIHEQKKSEHLKA